MCRRNLKGPTAGRGASLSACCLPAYAAQGETENPPQVDSKKELEKALKATCEAFIMGATKATVEEMLSFITKVTAVKVASTTGTVTKPLREQVCSTFVDGPLPLFLWVRTHPPAACCWRRSMLRKHAASAARGSSRI